MTDALRQSSSSSERSLSIWLIGAGLIVLAVAPFLQTLRHEFVNYDDMMYVYENEIVLEGLTWNGVRYAFTTMEGGNWHPLTWLSHMLDVQLWRDWAGGHHLGNVVLHAMNTILVFLLLLRMTSALWRCALVAALFAVHPLHVESVAWVSERKDVLSTFFGLIAVLLFVRYAAAPSVMRYTWIVIAFGLSLLAKPMLVTLPCVLLLLDIWPLRRVQLKLWPVASETIAPNALFPQRNLAYAILEKVPLLLMSAAFAVLAIVSQGTGKTIAPIDLLPLDARIANAIVAYGMYISKTLWPIDLAVFYPHPVRWEAWIVAACGGVLVGISVLAFALRRTRPWLLIGWLWFLGMLVPVIGIVQVGYQYMADRYAYVPIIGLFIMAIWNIPSLQRGWTKRLVVTMSLIAVAACTAVSIVQTSVWRDSRALFSHALVATRGNYVAHHNLANELERDGELDAALMHYQQAATLRPRNPTTWQNIGTVLLQLGRLGEAIEPLRIAYEMDPQSAAIANSLGVCLLSQSRIDEAIEVLAKAVELDSTHLESQGNYGAALLKKAQWEQAIPHLAYVAQHRPERVGVRTNLARALAQTGRKDEAIAELRAVLQASPAYEPARVLMQELSSTSSP